VRFEFGGNDGEDRGGHHEHDSEDQKWGCECAQSPYPLLVKYIVKIRRSQSMAYETANGLKKEFNGALKEFEQIREHILAGAQRRACTNRRCAQFV
jgi:hypothetical protein